MLSRARWRGLKRSIQESSTCTIASRPGRVREAFRPAEDTYQAITYPVAMVRDATGQVISFARGGAATLWSQSGRFDVVFSDGVAERRVRGMVPR